MAFVRIDGERLAVLRLGLVELLVMVVDRRAQQVDRNMRSSGVLARASALSRCAMRICRAMQTDVDVGDGDSVSRSSGVRS